MMEVDDDDPVVEEFPVYLSHSLANQLFVFQYPTRSAAANYDNDIITKCSIKPEHQEVRMEIALNTQSSNYDKSHGEQIAALNVDGSKDKPRQDSFFQSTLMDKKFLVSSRGSVDTSNFAIGTIQDNKFIISPLKGVISMQPAFPYLDKRAEEEAMEQDDAPVSRGEEEDASKRVTVKFLPQGNDQLKQARERSFDYLSKKSEEEKWYHTQYHTSSTLAAEIERYKFNAVCHEDKTSQMCLSLQQYMDNLVPAQHDLTWTTPKLPPHVVSLTALRNKPLTEIVKVVLKEVKMITFQQLSYLLMGHGNIIRLLHSIQEAAVLVHGNWVIKSDVIYSKDSFSQPNSVPGEVMCRERDYILYLLSTRDTVERKMIAATVKLPPEELKEILSQVAQKKLKKGWVLKLPPDEEFIYRFPRIVKNQALAWEARCKQLRGAFQTPCPPSETNIRSRWGESSTCGGSDLEPPIRSRPSQPGNPRRRKYPSFSSNTVGRGRGKWNKKGKVVRRVGKQTLL